jgi:hypothetical protein
VLRHVDTETTLWHGEVDPFHVDKDKAGGRLSLGPIDIAAEDVVDYRVDPGHGGANTSCDWSYLRELKFTKATATAKGPAKRSSPARNHDGRVQAPPARRPCRRPQPRREARPEQVGADVAMLLCRPSREARPARPALQS